MNDELRDDPTLRPLEARLAAIRPVLPDHECRELLFQCAFAAGRTAGARWTRRWRVASMALVVLMAGMSIPLVNDRLIVARLQPAAIRSAAPVEAHVPRNVQQPLPRVALGPLDAWQVPTDPGATFETALSKFKELDSNSRSQAICTMARVVDTVP